MDRELRFRKCVWAFGRGIWGGHFWSHDCVSKLSLFQGGLRSTYRSATLQSHNAVWNRKYMEPKTGYTLRQLWTDSEPAIGRKSSPSSDVKDSDIHRAVAAFADLPSSTLPDSPSFSRWGRQQPKMPTTNWHLSTKSSGGMGTHPMRKQGSCDP